MHQLVTFTMLRDGNSEERTTSLANSTNFDDCFLVNFLGHPRDSGLDERIALCRSKSWASQTSRNLAEQTSLNLNSKFIQRLLSGGQKSLRLFSFHLKNWEWEALIAS